MEYIIAYLQAYGLLGLIIIAFTESFISPILPDLLLIPMALSAPDKAIYYSLVATIASVIGGILGYIIGKRYGQPIFTRVVPKRYAVSIEKWVAVYGGWAVVMAALAPIPYKFISISAGVFRLNPTVFLLASIVGRAKRFLLEGVLIFYFGPAAVTMMKNYSNHVLVGVAAAAGLLWLGFKWRKRAKLPSPLN